MPTFDVEANGRSFEVEAPDHQTAIAALRSQPASVWETAKSFGTGVAKGMIGLAGLPADAANLAVKGLDYIKPGAAEVARQSGKYFPFKGSTEIQKDVERVTGEFRKPQNTTEEYAQTIGEFVPSVVGPGGAAAIPRNLVKYAAIPGAASEFAGQQTKGTALEPYARAAAGIGTGLTAAALSGPASAAGVLRSRMSENVTPAVVQDARQLMIDAQQRGVRLTWPEAIDQVMPGSGLPSMQRVVEAAPQSRPAMQEFYAGRPQEIEQAGRGAANTIAPPAGNPSAIGRAVGGAAEEHINDIRDTINQTARPFYDAASTIRLTPQEMGRVRAIPGYVEARDAVRNDPQLNRYVAGLPEDSVGFLNEVKKYLDNAATNASAPVNAQRNMQRSAGYGRDATSVRGEAVDAYFGNPARNYETALNIESHGRERFLQPLLDGPLGKIASQDTTTKKAIEALFPSNPLPNSQQEISTAVRALVQRRPAAAEQLVRAHIESAFNEATQALQTGANQAGGAKLWATLTGNTQQRANLQAAIEALPNGAARWQGFNRLMDVMEATGRRMPIGSNTSFNTLELAMLRGGSAVEGGVKLGTSPGKWFSAVSDKISEWRQGRNLTQLAAIITDPASGQVFERIAAAPRGVEQALLLARLVAVVGGGAAAGIRAKQPEP